MRRHELSDAEWSRIKPLLGSRSGPPSKRRDRDFINAVIWRVKTGVQCLKHPLILISPSEPACSAAHGFVPVRPRTCREGLPA
ncbi:transposase [Corallococcus coralloides]|nr:transposase [Corallococcus coralloides]